MHPLLQKIASVREKKIISIELFFLSTDTFRVSGMLLKKGNKGIEFSPLEDLNGDIQSWNKFPSKEIALILTFTGRGIISKRIELNEQTPFHLKNILPNANHEDFFHQLIETKNHGFVSIIRKEQCRPILEVLKQKGYLVAAINLGAIHGYPIANLLGVSTIQAGNYQIEMENNEPANIVLAEEDNETIRIDGKTVSVHHKVSLGSGIAYYQNQIIQNPVIYDLTKNDSSELAYRNLLYKVGLGSVSMVLIALLFNVYFKDYYQERYGLLSDILMQTSAERSELQMLKTELEEKRELINSIGWMRSGSISYYADRIAASVPSNIILSEMNIFPLKSNKMNRGEKVEFTGGIISVKGNVPDSESLNTWVETIRLFDWTEEVIIEKYQHASERSVSEFILRIKTNQA